VPIVILEEVHGTPERAMKVRSRDSGQRRSRKAHPSTAPGPTKNKQAADGNFVVPAKVAGVHQFGGLSLLFNRQPKSRTALAIRRAGDGLPIPSYVIIYLPR